MRQEVCTDLGFCPDDVYWSYAAFECIHEATVHSLAWKVVPLVYNSVWVEVIPNV